ncbi:alpha/beta fold hydrolase [Aureibacillus halotolerans]|uniref:Pimeloyl-ACP methyl ester carboxylesterase n=1 Tax=Aureibacillus halotolerans TaxID=1508390 RepID=A0A4R6U3W1_9BACI|nr:alpha/beta hydrolase [Aureibacillus halotolerans]TDQ37744.1 pimeloyl-ACP methyl ester carboxylesterase [Aureibacillus halotolerans]
MKRREKKKQMLGHFKNETAKNRFFSLYDDALSQWPASTTMMSLETSFGTTKLYTYGASKQTPLILLHGLNATSNDWVNNLEAIGNERTVYVIDMLGDAGKSEQTDSVHLPEDAVSWLSEVVGQLHLTAFHLGGTSYGGWLALRYTREHASRVKSLLLTEPAQAIVRLSLLFWAKLLWAQLIGPDAMRKRLYKWMCAYSPDPLQEKLSVSAMRDFRMLRTPPLYMKKQELESIQVPLLLVLGMRSPVHSARRMRKRALSLWPNAAIHLFKEGGHRVHAQLPHETNKLMKDFMEKLDD